MPLSCSDNTYFVAVKEDRRDPRAQERCSGELTKESQSRAGRTTRDAAELVDCGPVDDVLVKAKRVREASSVYALGVDEPELNDQ